MISANECRRFIQPTAQTTSTTKMHKCLIFSIIRKHLVSFTVAFIMIADMNDGIFGAGITGTTRSYELIIEQVTGSPPTKSNFLSEDSGARVRKLSRTSRPGLFWVLNATKEFPNNTNLFGHLFEGHNNAFVATLIDYKNNFCHYLETEKIPLFRTVKDALKLPDKCPFGPGFYKVDNWRLDERLLPPILPGGDKYMLQMGFEFTKTDAPFMNVYLRIDRKKGRGVLGR